MNQRIERNKTLDYIFRFLCCFSITDAIWVLYMSYKGLPLWQIGIAEGIFHITGLLSEVPTGALADLMGRKKVILLSRISSMISIVIILFANGFWQFAIGFIFSAWGHNLLSGSEEALIYDSFKLLGQENLYYRFNSRIEVVIEVAGGLSIFIGGVLAEKSFTYSYIAALIIAVISLLPALLFQEPEFVTNRIQKNRISVKDHFILSYRIIKSSPAVVEILLFYSFVFTFYTSCYFYCQQYFAELGLNKIYISLVMLVAGIFSILGSLASEKVVNLMKHKTKYIATLVISIGIGGLSTGNIVISVICFSIMSFANSILYPMQSASLNELIPSEQRATIISVSSMTFSMFMILLFPIIGFLADMIGLKHVFAFVGLLVLFILIIICKKRNK